MPAQKAQFTVKGMSRDLADSKFSPEYAFENKNIRITPTEHSTLLVLSNEKGNALLDIHSFYRVNPDSPCTVSSREVLGYAVLYKSVVLFQKATFTCSGTAYTNKDCISKLLYNQTTKQWEETILFAGDLKFDVEHPIETLPLYEAEDIQKVYWVDGKNQPRVINIIKDDDHNIREFNDEQFDFVPTLELNESITITRQTQPAGRFPAGALQYAITYSKKNGQESKIVWISNVHYTTFEERGGAPDELTPASYRIEIDESTIDTNFDNINIYSILRTSEDGGLQVKLVTRLDIDPAQDERYRFTDTNNTGETIAPTDLLYKGGEVLIANTLATKDNTLFLGNIKYLGSTVPQEIVDEAPSCTVSTVYITIDNWMDDDGFYPYKNPLLQDTVTYLRKGNKYRLGLQLQDDKGNWSEPLFVQDYPPTGRPYIDRTTGALKIPSVEITLTQTFIDYCTTTYGYKRIRPVVVFPESQERGVIAQGIVCPTVFRKDLRLANAPFAQSSWFFRPYSGTGYDANAQGTKYSVEARHCHILPDASKYNAEVQNATHPEDYAVSSTSNYNYYVDGSILTFHSPDVNDTLMEGDLLNSDLKIVGAFAIDSIAGREVLLANAPYLTNGGYGKLPDSFYNVNKTIADSSWSRNILTTRAIWKDVAQATLTGYSSIDLATIYYAVYPFQRKNLWVDFATAGVDNELIRGSGEIIKKVFSNIRVSQDFEFYSSYEETLVQPGLRDRRIFRKENNDTAFIVKSPNNMSSSCNFGSLLYKGGINDALVQPDEYSLYGTETYDSALENLSTKYTNVQNNFGLYTSRDIIPITYRSEDHIVLALSNTPGGETQELPVPVFSSLDPDGSKTRRNFIGNPFWLAGDSNVTRTDLDSSFVIALDQHLQNPDFIASLYNGQRVITCEDPYLPMTLTAYQYNADTGMFSNYAIYNQGINASQTGEGIATLLLGNVTLYAELNSTGDLKNLRNTVLYANVTQWGQVWEIPEPDAQVTSTKALPSDIATVANQGKEVMWITELTRDITHMDLFGGDSEYAIKNNKWYPCGEACAINNKVVVQEGDTIFNRWDCLKTLPYTPEDPNQIVEVMSFMCESYVNTAGRYDKNQGRGDYTYLNASVPFNQINPAYNNKDNFFTYRITDLQKNKDTEYPTLVTWSLTKTLGEEIDSWTHITLASSMSMDGDRGKVRALRRYKNSIFCFQDKGIAEIIYNPTTAVATTAGVPIEIANSGKVEGKRYISEDIGCTNKWSICITAAGIYFIDSINKKVYHWSDNGMNCLSEQYGFTSFFNTEMGEVIDNWYPHDWGQHDDFITQYDRTVGDVYFINSSKCLTFNESLGQFTSLYDYNEVPFFINLDTHCFSVKNGKLWDQHAGDYNRFFGGSPSPYYTEVVVNPNPTEDKIFDNIEFRADSWNADGTLRTDTFDKLTAENEYQKGELSLTFVKDKAGIPYSPLKKKFRIWYANIPRNTFNRFGDNNHNYTRDRMRNTWIHLKLEKSNPGTERTVLHDLQVKYFI